MASVAYKRGPVLPQVTRDYLENGANEGERNNALHHAACQMRDAGLDVTEAGPQLLARAIADGLLQSEAVATINSAYSRAAREPIVPGVTQAQAKAFYAVPKATTFAVDPIPADLEAVELPEPISKAANAAIAQLEAWFRTGEFVSIETGKPFDGDKPLLLAGETRTREEWIQHIKETANPFQGALGVFVRVNPMKSGGSAAKDVADFRSTLIEFDNIPKPQQYALFLKSGLPIRSLVDSGGDSIHAVVAIDAKDAEQFKERVEVVRAPERSTSGQKVESILIFLKGSELTSGDWESKAKEFAKINRTDFYKLKAEAEERGLVIKPESQRGKWRLSPEGEKLLTPQS